jgi:cell division protein FtsW (lipid II flippase)
VSTKSVHVVLRRRSELGLVLLAAVITSAAYVLAALGKNASLPAKIGPFLGSVIALLVVAHLAVRRWAPGASPLLLPIAALLHGVGYVMIARLSDRLAGLQATWSLVAVAAFVFVLVGLRRVTDLVRYQYAFLGLGIALQLLPLVPGIGFSSGGARIWVSIGPINFQPGEFAKLCLAIFFAGYLAEQRELIRASGKRVARFELPDVRAFLPVLLAWGVSVVVMVAERDLGSSLLFFTLFVVMLWIATERTGYLVLGSGLFVMGALIAYQLFGHVQDRVSIWLDPWSEYNGKGYQIVQGMFALAEGGMSGTGLGLGDPGRIPAVKTDFIFAAIGEELGLFGGTAVLIAFVLLMGSGLRTAVRTDNAFEKLLAVGLTTILGVQAFIILAGVLRVLPLTGVTLPFMSYGGSSLVANYMLLALLIAVSHSSARRLHEVES